MTPCLRLDGPVERSCRNCSELSWTALSFAELARSRSMTRAFRPDAVPEDILHQVLDLARRVPSAGNTQGFDFVVLTGTKQTALYWDVTLPGSAGSSASPNVSNSASGRDRRAGFRWQGLLTCPVLVTVWANPTAYVERYSEPDKATTGLGDSAAWSTPYWLIDAAFAALALQYAALDVGLGVLFFGMFDHAPAVAAALGVPADREPVGTVAIGWPAHVDPTDPATQPARSAARPRRPLIGGSDAVVHLAGW